MIRVVQIDQSKDDVLKRLMEFYLHDLAEWFKFDQTPEGDYTYETEALWQNGVDVHLLYAEDVPIGFGLVATGEPWMGDPNSHDLKEFFVVRRHRGTGIGRFLAEALWRKYPGPWVVRVMLKNKPAVPFWRKVIAEFTHEDYEEQERLVGDKAWSYFSFSSTAEGEQLREGEYATHSGFGS